jgi:hypothetical protein
MEDNSESIDDDSESSTSFDNTEDEMESNHSASGEPIVFNRDEGKIYCVYQ